MQFANIFLYIISTRSNFDNVKFIRC